MADGRIDLDIDLTAKMASSNIDKQIARLSSEVSTAMKKMDSIGFENLDANTIKLANRVQNLYRHITDTNKPMAAMEQFNREVLRSSEAYQDLASQAYKAKNEVVQSGRALTESNAYMERSNRLVQEMSSQLSFEEKRKAAIERTVEANQRELDTLREKATAIKAARDAARIQMKQAVTPEAKEGATAKYNQLASSYRAVNALADTYAQKVQKGTQALQESSYKVNDIRTGLGMAKSDADMYAQKVAESARAYDAAKAKLAEMQNQMQNFKSSEDTSKLGTGAIRQYEQVINVLARAQTSIDKLNSSLGQTPVIKNPVGDAPAKLSKAAMAAKLLKGALKGVVSVMSKLKGATGNYTSDATKGIKKLTKMLTMYGLGFRSLFFLIKRLRKTFIDALGTMAKQFPEINKQMSELKQNFNGLKGALGTALQPLFSALQPALISIIKYLTTALELLGKFLAVLTGQGYIYKATADNVDYAKSLDKTGDSAKKAAKKLAAYDELLVIDQNDSSSSGSGSTGGLDGVTYEKEMINAESALAQFAQKLKDLFSNGLFEDAGNLIGTAIVDGLNSVPWETIQKKAGTFGKNLAQFLNGLFKTDGLGASIGNTLAQALNTALEFISGFVEEFDFSALGTTFGTAIDTLFKNFKWTKFGKTFGNLAKGLLDAITSAITAVDWMGLGTSIAEAWNAIDWEGIGKSLTEAISAAFIGLADILTGIVRKINLSTVLDALIGLLSGLDLGGIVSSIVRLATNLIGTIVKTLISGEFWTKLGLAIMGIVLKIPELLAGAVEGIAQGLADIFSDLGLDSIAGFFQGIADCAKDAVTYIRDFFDKIVKAAKDFLGIHSPSTVFAEIGGYIIDGLKNGISNGIEKIKEICGKLWTAVTDKFKDIAGWFKEKFDLVVTKIKGVFGGTGIGDAASGAWDKIKDVFKGVADWFKEKFDAVVTKITNVFGGKGIKEAASGAWDKIKEVFANIANWFKEKFDAVVTKITNVFGGKGIGDAASGALGKIKDVFKGIADWFKEKFDAVVTKIKNAFEAKGIKTAASGAWSAIKGVFSSVTTFFKDKFSGAWDAVKKVFSSGGSAFKGITDGITSTFKSIVNKLIDGINTVVATPFTKIQSALNTIKNTSILGAKPFSFLPSISIPRIPHLAQGAVIPPNKEFLAMLGDQRRGTNIETPLDTMIEAFTKALDSRGGTSQQPIILQLDGRTVAEVVWDEQSKYYKQTGRYSPAY